MKGLTDIPGIRVGHVSDFEAITGCTAILCEQGAVCGVDIRGSATGTQEIDTLGPATSTERIHGDRAGGRQRVRPGSGVAACGATWSAAKSDSRRAASSADRAGGDPLRSWDRQARRAAERAMGEAAAAAATADAVAEGNVGAGTGATVGKLFGMRRR